MRSARSHTRSRFSREDTGTSPRCSMKSSSLSTLRLLVHPVDCHGTAQVSLSSRAGSLPLRLQSLKDVLAAGVVGRHPIPDVDLPVLELPSSWPLGHLGTKQRDVVAGPQHAAELHQ